MPEVIQKNVRPGLSKYSNGPDDSFWQIGEANEFIRRARRIPSVLFVIDNRTKII